MSNKLSSYKKKKWLYLALTLIAYFVPYITVTAVFFSFIDVAAGYKAAIGIAIVALNAVPLLMGLCRMFTAHFPMFNIMAVIFCIIAMFFTVDFFQEYVDKFCWIELAAAVGSVLSCIFWHFYKTYRDKVKYVTTCKDSGVFELKSDSTDSTENG